MENQKIKINTIVESQLPDFVKENYPLVSEILTEYYKSLEVIGSSLDIIQNIHNYVKINNISNLIESTILLRNISSFDDVIHVNSTSGFPKTYGLILIDDEIILYKSKSNTTFNECIRGFSGIMSYNSRDDGDLSFSSSKSSSHELNKEVKNLNSLFLKEFLIKIKKQIAFGFEDTNLYSNLNENLFLKQSKDFYSSKGTNRSFEILFRILYGKDVDIILPRDYLISPSNAEYRVTKNLIIEPIEGNPEDLINKTIFQDEYNNIPKSFATVIDVQRFVKNNNQYYVLMLDYDFDKDIIVSGSIFGELKIHPKTTVVENVQENATEISVESTIGFQESGELTLNNGVIDLYIKYKGKTVNQFLNCDGITSIIPSGTAISINTFAYGFSDNGLNKIKFRISGILSDIDVNAYNVYNTEKSRGKIITLGYNSNNVKDVNWIFNKTVKCDVLNFTSSGTNSYTIETIDDSGITFGDSVEIDLIRLNSAGNQSRESIVIPGNQVVVPIGSPPGRKFQINNINYEIVNIFTVKRLVNKYKGKFLSDVLNIYKDFSNDEIYITSSSLPSYGSNYNIEDYSITFNSNFYNEDKLKLRNIGDHGFLTGDAIVYLPEKVPSSLGISSGVYFVYRENSKEIKLYRSRSDIYRQKNNPTEQNYITFNSVGIGTTTGTLLNTERSLISGINTLGIGISIGNYLIDDNEYNNNFIKNDTIITSIGQNSIALSQTHKLSLGSTITSFSFREPTTDYLKPLKFFKNNSDIDSQKIVRVLKNPKDDGKDYKTDIGTIGILVNGIEILNYKSNDFIYYGPIESIEVINGGKDYDLINPPILKIKDSNVTGNDVCEAHCHIEGSLERIDIIDPGFNYIDTPIITITGGNGYGAKVIPNIIQYDYSVTINSSITNDKINLSNNVLGFSTYHKFYDGECVLYKTYRNTPVGGLSSDSKYYVNVLDDYKIKLHKNFDDAINKTNEINLSSYGIGEHEFESLEKKNKLNSIHISDRGYNYKNKKILVSSSGISTISNTINVYKHPYLSGETIYYFGSSGSNISGLSVGSYIVTKVDDSSFKLSNVGIGSISKDFFYKTNQYINFKSKGNGTHTFNYDPINVQINGKIGISSVSTADVTAKIQPVFRGKISSVFVSKGGVGYGSSDIINYNKQPEFNLQFGNGSRVTPVISNGKILDIIINESGSEYNSPPDVVVRGSGVGAVLSPVIQNGKLVDIKIINSGINYSPDDTIIEIISPGTGYELFSYPKVWTINQLQRLVNAGKLPNDRSVIYKGNNNDYGLQYTHIYAPEVLRKSLYSMIFEDDELKYRNDYENDRDSNVIKYHSPIIGWAYDGNPIYGPYGYTSIDDKTVKLMNSGYELTNYSRNVRPSKNVFPLGYLIEDYKFTNSGDLDKHNGRFCVTPDYPKGVYAYFMTIDPEDMSLNKSPKFPYIIGDTYKSTPINFNFSDISNQDKFSFENNNLIRNTTPYNTLSEYSKYEYFPLKNELSNQNINVTSIQNGQVESVKVISGGFNYKVNDKVIFDNNESGGFGVSAKVDLIHGKQISNITQNKQTVYDVEFYPYLNGFIGICTSHHDLSNNNIISIDALNFNNNILSGTFNLDIINTRLVLNNQIGDIISTGIVTYFYVSGSLEFPNIKENDIFKINDEEIKILNIDKESSRIRVIREYNSSSSSNHSSYTILNEKSRKFYINIGNKVQNDTYNLNREIYFNPAESLGLGSNDYTLYFSNPGVGLTYISIPSKSIYLKNHNLNNGDSLIYKSNSGVSIRVSNGNYQFDLDDNTEVFVHKISNDLIGISTVRTSTDLSFIDIGNGEYHSFSTNFENTLKGNAIKNIIRVNTNSSNNLSINDTVVLDTISGISTTVKVLYNEYNRRLLINPKSFSEVNVINNTITIINHGYISGNKVLYTSSYQNSNLINETIYYVIVYDENRIKLTETFYDSIRKDPKTINFSSSFSGTLSEINPQIEITKNNLVTFDLSDSSLSEIADNGIRVESFDFEFFFDNNFGFPFIPINSNQRSKIIKTGTIGIDAKITFSVDNEFPNEIYYNLIPKSNRSIKNELTIDKEVLNYNKIIFKNSKLNGQWIVRNTGSSYFDIQVPYVEDFDVYVNTNENLRYYTNSLTDFGSIYSIKITSGGNLYKILPKILTVNSKEGNGAILIPQSTSIGKINSTEINNNNYNYPIDNTLKPLVKFSSIVRIEPLNSIENIEVVSPGLFYNTSPDLILIDGFTNEVIDDVDLQFNIENNNVLIIENTKGIYNVTPRIVSINNTNGLGINSVSYNTSSKIVTLYLTKQFSDFNTFPINNGDKILVEGISIVNSSGRGFNSKDYNYSLFTVIDTFENLGGSGASIQYSLSEYLEGSQVPGTFEINNSSGRVINENELPKFKVNLVKNSFIIGENVFSNDKVGKVVNWEKNNEYLTVEVLTDFNINELITGESSKSRAFVKDIIKLEQFYDVSSSNIVKNGWNRDIGFLNNPTQRIHDSDYYQYFSYSIKSEIPIDKWDIYVNNLNHTLGFKRFSDLILNSSTDNVGIETNQNNGSFTSICELNSITSVDCIQDFDIVSENYFYNNQKLTSNEIIFNSTILIDYSESVGNRVLMIDDISKDFNTQLSNTFVASFNI